jgi:predicted nucleic acid-binding protein
VPSVVDASALIELLSGNRRAGPVAAAIGAGDALAPELIDAEVLAGARRLERTGRISAARGKELVASLRRAPIHRQRHGALLEPAWDLRHNVTAYDALYVALAELTGGVLVTADKRLASACAGQIAVTLVPAYGGDP